MPCRLDVSDYIPYLIVIDLFDLMREHKAIIFGVSSSAWIKEQEQRLVLVIMINPSVEAFVCSSASRQVLVNSLDIPLQDVYDLVLCR